MTDDPFRSPAPWRHQFDHARDPYAARIALGIPQSVIAGGGGGGGGNVSNSGTPTLGQYAKWVTATTIQGVAPATVLSDIGAQPAGSYQPLDADLTAIAALTGTNTIYYRSAANTWAAVTIGANLTFTGGTLAATGGGGGTPGGSTTQMQYNNAGAFGGAANLTWNNAASVLTLTGQLAVNVGNATSVVAAGVVEASSFKCTSSSALLSPGSAGNIILRPSGPITTAGQLLITAASVTASTPVVLPANPTTNLQAATKQYVDLFAPLASPTFTGDPKAPTPTAGDNDTSIATTAFVTAAVAAGGGGGTATPGPPQGRLSLQTATPVMTTTQAAKIIIYYTPYVGNRVPIYDGTTTVMTTFAELSVATADTIKSPAAIGASKVNDWFVWSDAGTVRLGHGPDWTDDSTRSAGTALVRVNGIWLNNASITNGPTASRGTYVGTTRSNASSQLDWILPSAAAGGGKGTLGVWNAYNRVLAGGACIDTTASWITASTTIRAKNNSANNAIAFVSGLQEDVVQAFNAHGLVINASDGTAIVCGIGVDTTTAFTSTAGQGSGGASVTAGVPRAEHTAQSLGYHTWNAVEATNTATNTQSFGNIAGPPARNYSSLTFAFPM